MRVTISPRKVYIHMYTVVVSVYERWSELIFVHQGVVAPAKSIRNMYILSEKLTRKEESKVDPHV